VLDEMARDWRVAEKMATKGAAEKACKVLVHSMRMAMIAQLSVSPSVLPL